MRKFLIGTAAAALMAGGAALAQSQQGTAEAGDTAQQQAPATGQGIMSGQGMGPGMMAGQGGGPMHGMADHHPWGIDRHGMDGRQGMRGGGMMGGMGRGLMAGPGMGPHMIQMMLVLVDTDESGSLSLEEIQAVHARMFRLADANDDGELTPEEMSAFMHPGSMPSAE